MSCSQSAVSQHVKRLEREIGLALFERLPRGVALTPAGQVLHRAAAEGLGSLESALRVLGEMERGEGGTVRITTGATTVRHFMTEAVVAFRSRHPEVLLEFQTGLSSRRCIEAVRDHEADLAWITMGPPVTGVEQRPAFMEYGWPPRRGWPTGIPRCCWPSWEWGRPWCPSCRDGETGCA
jgi:DNA-binding transcriptional LysR family regulator